MAELPTVNQAIIPPGMGRIMPGIGARMRRIPDMPPPDLDLTPR